MFFFHNGENLPRPSLNESPGKTNKIDAKNIFSMLTLFGDSNE